MLRTPIAMGHDFVKYEGHGERFHDGVLWILRHFLLAEARSMESARADSDTAELRTFIEKWDWLCPGVVTGTDLSEFVRKSPSRWQMMLELLQRTGDRIAYFGEAIPKDYLQANAEKANLGVRYNDDIPTRRLLTDIGRLCRLLSEDEPLVAAVVVVEDEDED